MNKDNDADDDHRGEFNRPDPLQVHPGENKVEFLIVKDCDPPSLQVLVVGGRPEKYPNFRTNILPNIMPQNPLSYH